MGKTTKYHPVSLHVIRGSAEQCGFKFSRMIQLSSDPTGLSALYKATIAKMPDAYFKESIHYIKAMLDACFASDISIVSLVMSTDGTKTALIRTSIQKDAQQVELPMGGLVSKPGGGGGFYERQEDEQLCQMCKRFRSPYGEPCRLCRGILKLCQEILPDTLQGRDFQCTNCHQDKAYIPGAVCADCMMSLHIPE